MQDPSLNRACEACRTLKVRCLPGVTSPKVVCQRCIKFNRDCVFATAQKRKPRKRTDARVAELEREVQAMRSLMTARKQMEKSGANDAKTVNFAQPSDLDGKPSRRQSSLTGSGSTPNSNPSPQSSTSSSDTRQSTSFKGFKATIPDVDVIDRGLLTVDQAEDLFKIYYNEFHPHYPILALPPDYTMVRLREEKPIIFAAMMAVTTAKVDPDLHSTLSAEAIQIFAARFMFEGEGSLDLVQALLLTTAWYYPPDTWGKLRFYETVHMAATMGINIGLHTRTALSDSGTEVLTQGRPFDATSVVASEFQCFERAKILLSNYATCTGVSLSLRRPTLLQYTDWMGECKRYMENSSYATPMDRCFLAWIKVVNIADNITIAFSYNDYAHIARLSQIPTQHMMAVFDTKLKEWREETSAAGVLNVALSVMYNYVTLLNHEMVLHPIYDPDTFNAPYSMVKPKPNEQHYYSESPAITDSLSTCVVAADDLINVFLSTDMQTCRCFPNHIFSRTVHALIVLVRISLMVENTKYLKVDFLDVGRPKMERYFRRLIRRLVEAGGDAEYRIPYTFAGPIIKLGKFYRYRQLATDNPLEVYSDEPLLIMAPTPGHPANDVEICGTSTTLAGTTLGPERDPSTNNALLQDVSDRDLENLMLTDPPNLSNTDPSSYSTNAIPRSRSPATTIMPLDASIGGPAALDWGMTDDLGSLSPSDFFSADGNQVDFGGFTNADLDSWTMPFFESSQQTPPSFGDGGGAGGAYGGGQDPNWGFRQTAPY